MDGWMDGWMDETNKPTDQKHKQTNSLLPGSAKMDAEVEKCDGEAVPAAASEAEAAGQSSAVAVAQAASAEQPGKQKVQYGVSKFFNPSGQSEHKPVLAELEKRKVGRPAKLTPAMLKALEPEKAELTLRN